MLEVKNIPLLIVMAGTSGAGKDTVINQMRLRGLPFHFVVTATSRERRPGEVDGVDYIFVSKERFEEMIANGELIEHAVVYGQYKGVPRDQVQQALLSGKDVVMRLDVQGASAMRKLYPEAILIFIAAEGHADTADRLEDRSTDSEQAVRERLETAAEEMRRIGEYDYLVVNRRGRLEETVDTVIAIIHAEHFRVRRLKGI